MSFDDGYDWGEPNSNNGLGVSGQDRDKFEKLLDVSMAGRGCTPSNVTKDKLLKGTIVSILSDFVVVDVSLKSEGVISTSEFENPNDLTVGMDVEVYLDCEENDDGQVVLSRKKARQERMWEQIVDTCEEGSIVTGRVLHKVKGGLIVDIGIDAFLPGSQIDNKKVKCLDEYIGNEYEFKVIKINLERKNIVVSRKELIDDQRNVKRIKLLDNVKEGERRIGVVKNVTDFGAFLDIDGVDGLLHVTDMKWERCKNPHEVVQPGEAIEVVVLHVDKERSRVALGLKQKYPNPWKNVEARYPIGKKVTGKIVKLVAYGAFCELEPGIEGLIHVYEMSWDKKVLDPSDEVSIGDNVDVVVLYSNEEEGKISLGMKQVRENPWENIEEKFPVNTKVRAKVHKSTNFGVFVFLSPGIEGLVHISDISWVKRISHPSELFKEGDEIDVIVLAIDKESKKITLGMKQLQPNPWESVESAFPVGSIVDCKVTRIAPYGIFLQLPNEMEGLVHVSDISDKGFGKIVDLVTIGECVEARVTKIDADKKKISLSTRESNLGHHNPDHRKQDDNGSNDGGK